MKKPKVPEINAVANALVMLEDRGANGIKDAIQQLYLFCQFSREFEKKKLFWHEFKAKKGLV